MNNNVIKIIEKEFPTHNFKFVIDDNQYVLKIDNEETSIRLNKESKKMITVKEILNTLERAVAESIIDVIKEYGWLNE